jgi:hypothetical protein
LSQFDAWVGWRYFLALHVCRDVRCFSRGHSTLSQDKCIMYLIFAKRRVAFQQVTRSTPDTVTSHVIVGDAKLPIDWNSFHTLGLAMALRRNVKFGMDYSPVLRRPIVWTRNPSNLVNSSAGADAFSLSRRTVLSPVSDGPAAAQTMQISQMRPMVQLPAHDPASLFLAADQILSHRATDVQSPVTAQAPAAAAAPPHRIALSHGWPGKTMEASAKVSSPRSKLVRDQVNSTVFLPSPYPHAVPVLWPLADMEHMRSPVFWPMHAPAPFPASEIPAVPALGPILEAHGTIVDRAQPEASCPIPALQSTSPKKRAKCTEKASAKPHKRKKVRRLEYVCGKCGQVKKGHVCTNPRDDGNPWV